MIGENIKKIREEKGMTQKDVAEKAKELGITLKQEMISMIENCRREPSDKQIDNFCILLECERKDIMKGEFDEEYTKAYNDGYSVGVNFKPHELSYMVRDLTFGEYNDRIEKLLDGMMKLTNTKVIPLPTTLARLNKRDESDSRLFYGFIIGLWNGTHVND